MERSPFSQWTEQRLRDVFGLREAAEHPLLTAWLDCQVNDPPPLVEDLRAYFARHARSWNEEELKVHFIGPLLTLVRFDGEDYGMFAGRTLTAQVGEYELSGTVDGLVARGRYDPVAPYFCLHEYKPEKGRDLDPAAQLLAAMLAARAINQDQQPVYGCYVLGRNWFFAVLDGAEPKYAFSQAFDAASEDVFQIFAVLQQLKKLVEARCESIVATESTAG